MKEISRRAGKGKFSTSFYKEQCHLVNVEVVRRMMSLFKNKFFFFHDGVLHEERGRRGKRNGISRKN